MCVTKSDVFLKKSPGLPSLDSSKPEAVRTSLGKGKNDITAPGSAWERSKITLLRQNIHFPIFIFGNVWENSDFGDQFFDIPFKKIH